MLVDVARRHGAPGVGPPHGHVGPPRPDRRQRPRDRGVDRSLAGRGGGRYDGDQPGPRRRDASSRRGGFPRTATRGPGWPTPFPPGGPLEVFRSMIEAHGGDPAVVDDPGRLPRAGIVREVPAPAEGMVPHTLAAAGDRTLRHEPRRGPGKEWRTGSTRGRASRFSKTTGRIRVPRRADRPSPRESRGPDGCRRLPGGGGVYDRAGRGAGAEHS